jgi:hypothetical protein
MAYPIGVEFIWSLDLSEINMQKTYRLAAPAIPIKYPISNTQYPPDQRKTTM